MKRFWVSVSVLAAVLVTSVHPAYAAAFTLSLVNGTEIGTSLLAADAAFEVSGIVYHPTRKTYVVVSDEGQVAEVSATGALLHEWKLGSAYDLEDVTLIDAASSVVYLADENTSSALAFDLATGKLTGKSWSFASYIYETADGAGLEGLTYVPDGQHPFGTTVSGGVFYAGWQQDGDIYVFEPNLSTGASTYREELHLEKGLTDLSALSYDRTSKIVYVVYDGLDRLEQRTTKPAACWPSALLSVTSLPGSNQEAFSAVSACATAVPTVAVGEDGGGVKIYASTSSCSSTSTTTSPTRPRHRR